MRGLSSTRGFALFSLLGLLVPACLFPQSGEPPAGFLRDHALVVRFLASAWDLPPSAPQPTGPGALIPAPGQTSSGPSSQTTLVPPSSPGLRNPTWTSTSMRYTMSGAPVAIRFAGDDLVVVVQVTPYDRGRLGLLLVAQGQVWRKIGKGDIDYRSAFESLSVAWGERVYFYPLGLNSDGSSAMRLEMAVDHYGDPPSIPDSDASGTAQQGLSPDSASPGKR